MPRAEMLSSFCAGGWGLGLSWTRKKLKVLRQHSEGTVRGAGRYLLNLVLITLQWLPIAYGVRLILCSLASEGLWSAPTSHHSQPGSPDNTTHCSLLPALVWFHLWIMAHAVREVWNVLSFFSLSSKSHSFFKTCWDADPSVKPFLTHQSEGISSFLCIYNNNHSPLFIIFEK